MKAFQLANSAGADARLPSATPATENILSPFLTWGEQIAALTRQMPTAFGPASLEGFSKESAVNKPAEKAAKKAAVKTEEKFKLSSPFVSGAAPKEIMSVLGKAGGQVIANPNLLAEEGGKLVRDINLAATGRGEVAPAKGDRRFADEIWHDSPFHKTAMQGYLAWTKAIGNVIDNVGLETKDKERLRYMSSLVTDAMSPSNNLLSNPVALKKAQETGGKSLTDGFKNLVEDLQNNGGLPAQVDKSAFTVGENIAATPGAVIYTNPIFELIQYKPTTDTVYDRPIMFVPPVVNKYYLLDLAPGKSAVEYLVEKGFQVFMVSWRNPTQEHRDWGLDEYVAALVEGIEVICDVTGSSDINLYAACTGAIPMSALLGYLAAKGKPLVKSATMVVAVLDSNDGQSLGLFTCAQSIAEAKRKSQISGVRDGDEMGRIFTWMRPNDLVWNYWVNNYLLGKRPPAFDILFWNNDSTRVTAKLHGELLDVFSQDLLRKPGGVTILGEPIDLSKVTCDVYMVGGVSDHISIWKGVYNSAKFFGGDHEFVLHSSGHVQSIINPPGNPKASYRHGAQTPQCPEQWLEQSETTPGSWWDHWNGWLGDRSGEIRSTPSALGSNQHVPTEAAPGRYVFEQ